MEDILAFYATAVGIQILIGIFFIVFQVFLICRFIRATSDLRDLRDDVSDIKTMYEADFRRQSIRNQEKSGGAAPSPSAGSDASAIS